MSSRIGTHLIGHYEPKCTNTDKFLQPPPPPHIYIGKGNVNSHTSLSIVSKLWPTDQLTGSTVTSIANCINRTLLETTIVLQLFQLIKPGCSPSTSQQLANGPYPEPNTFTLPQPPTPIPFFPLLILSCHLYQNTPLAFYRYQKKNISYILRPHDREN